MSAPMAMSISRREECSSACRGYLMEDLLGRGWSDMCLSRRALGVVVGDCPGGEWVGVVLPSRRAGCHLGVGEQGRFQEGPDLVLMQVYSDDDDLLAGVDVGAGPVLGGLDGE